METTFLICAGLGITLILCQFLMGLFGLGGDHGDLTDSHFDGSHGGGHDTGSENWFLGMLTFKTISTAITFFGLGGLSASYYNLPTPSIMIAAIACGLLAFYSVAMVMKGMTKLKADGTVNIEAAIGQHGTVYLRIPGFNEGPGKITLNLQNRTVEMEAVTYGPELPTGTAITVREILEGNIADVVKRDPA